MCGLVGAIGDLFVDDKKVFDYMLKLDVVRGPHSTGVARIPNKERDKPELIKAVGTYWDLVKDHRDAYYNSEKNHQHIAGEYCALMGHNRWATVGAITDQNAHPFVTGTIVGAQNGTLPSHWREKLEDYKDYGTDSEALFHNIDLYGVENVIPHLDGAWALTWYDIELDTFNILRNKERPLYFAWKKNGRVMFYASEAWMIYAAADHHKVDLQDDLVYEVNKDTHYSWELGDRLKFGKEAQREAPLKGFQHKPVVISKPVDYNTYYNSRNDNSTNSAAASANVFSNASPTRTAKFWHEKVGMFKEFTVSTAICTDEQKKRYIRGHTVDSFAEIRIYPSDKVDVFAKLGDKDVCTYAAKIKRVKTKGIGFYILIDVDTIMVATYNSAHYRKLDEALDEAIPFDEDDDKLRIMGQEVTEKEYKNALSNGCCWCSNVPDISKYNQIKWLSKNDYLCDDCSSNPDVIQYAAQFQ